jgi:hypothetical protein
MRRTVTVILLLALTVLTQGRATALAKPKGSARAGIQLAQAEEGLDAGQSLASFDLFQTRDLWIRVTVPKLDQVSSLNLTFTGPRGDVFYETNRFFTRAAQSSIERGSDGKHPLTYFQAKHVPGGFGLDQPIPIAGNVFQRYPTPGVWTIKARLSGSDEVLSTKVVVRVTP